MKPEPKPDSIGPLDQDALAFGSMMPALCDICGLPLRETRRGNECMQRGCGGHIVGSCKLAAEPELLKALQGLVDKSKA